VSEEEQDSPQAGAPEAKWKRSVHHFFTLQREPASNKALAWFDLHCL